MKKARQYWHILGPGLTTGSADDDPSGIATYSQAGSQYGFSLLWLAPLTFPLMALVQEMCARIGLVTGRGLAGNIRAHFSRKVLIFTTILLFAANTFNLGVDLGAMAKATQLLAPRLNFVFLVVAFTALSLVMQIFIPYKNYAKYLKWLAFVLLSYVVSALLIRLNWHEIIYASVVPTLKFSKDQIILICGILGTTISPYLFFWQTSQEVEEEILKGETTVKMRMEATHKTEIKEMRIDVWSGMFVSNLVMFFIITACAATLYVNGITNINSAADAALALRPLAGEASYLLFAIGILGAGLLAVPVLAGSVSYAISETFKWREGLYWTLKQAHAFYGVIIISMVGGLLVNFVGLDPIKALIYSAVANGIVAPVILVFIVRLSSNRKIMGEWTNRPVVTFWGWVTTGIMVVTAVATIISLF
ncbi:divalent metal cation transporter [bacterium]|nr:MAG: divalent metal cation transporter [bacterium]